MLHLKVLLAFSKVIWVKIWRISSLMIYWKNILSVFFKSESRKAWRSTSPRNLLFTHIWIVYYNSWNYTYYIDEQDYCIFRAVRKVSDVTTSIALFTICFASFSKGNLTSSQSTYFAAYHVLAIQFQQLFTEQKFCKSRVTKSTYKTELRKMTSHFELPTSKFL